MNTDALIECVPNFSEGKDIKIIEQITSEIKNTTGVKLLDVDPGKDTNRTVVTFVGHPENVIKAAFLAIKKASELIDMSLHKGEHPRMGATDVCPLIPISGITMEETVEWSKKLAEMVGSELKIPVYLYEDSATILERKNLATIRAGEYEGFEEKIKDKNWIPDYGLPEFNIKSGVTAIGARNFLIAYNVNLNTKSVRRANSVAFDVREKGRLKREGGKLTGKVILDKNGNPMRDLGQCKGVKAIGWYIDEYGVAQISMNITDIKASPIHHVFESCRKSANKRGLRITGSELVGLIPKNVLIDAGKYYLKKQNRSVGVSEEEIIQIAIKSLGLDELGEFNANKKIIEYLINDKDQKQLINMSLTTFANDTASEKPAPGGGSISAYLGVLASALGTMVANLSANKRGWEDKVSYYSSIAEKGQKIKDELLYLVDEDTKSFNAIISAIRLPKSSDVLIQERLKSIDEATKYSIQIPLRVMQKSYEVFDILEQMYEKGMSNCISDVGVGVLACTAAIKGASLNVKINCKTYDNHSFVEKTLAIVNDIISKSEHKEKILLQNIDKLLKKDS